MTSKLDRLEMPRLPTSALLKPFRWAALMAVVAPLAASAQTYQAGDIVFSQFLSGVNVFQISNFTGSNNLGFFPVMDDVAFMSPTLTLYCANAACEADLGGNSKVFSLANLAPSTAVDTSTLVSALDRFSRAVFTASLASGNATAPVTVQLSSGATVQVAASITATLLPANGNFLQASDPILGTVGDAVSINFVTAVPEPSAVYLFIVGLAAASVLAARRRPVQRLHVAQHHG